MAEGKLIRAGMVDPATLTSRVKLLPVDKARKDLILAAIARDEQAVAASTPPAAERLQQFRASASPAERPESQGQAEAQPAPAAAPPARSRLKG